MEVEIPDFNKVDEKIQGFMEEELKYEDEDILVAIPIDFKLDENDSFQKGFLMITQGSHYIFRRAILTGLQSMRIFNLLEVSSVGYSTAFNEISFIFEQGRNVYLKTPQREYLEQIGRATNFVIQTAVYGVSNSIQTFKIVGLDMPTVNFTKRPTFMLKWRIIFLVHFYGIKSQQMMPIEYFDKWEENSTLSSMMVIGPSLHPGKFSFAIGHAVAWESELRTVVLQNFAPSKFSDFFDALVSNAVTIKKLAFTDYQKAEKPISFSGTPIQSSSIKQFQFVRVVAPVVLSFFENERKIPQIESLILQNITITSQEFTKLADFATNNATMKDTLKFFELARSEIPDIHLHDLTKMINSFSALQTIAIRNMKCDGMRFLYSIARSTSPIRVIHVNCMNFKRPFKADQIIKYPSTLIHLDVSFSAFTDEAYVSLLNSITSYEMENPIIFESISLSLSQPSAFQLIGQMDFDNCFSNIVEFDYSGNQFPDESSRFLFAFIFTQKKIRMISLNKVECQDPVGLLKNVMLLVTTISLPALHMSDWNIDSDTFSQFISALSVQNPTYIKSLSFANSKSGTSGLIALTELISKCTNLVEIEADGFEPTEAEPFLELWRTISKHKAILSCDNPSEDLKALGLSKLLFTNDDKVVFQNIEEKSELSTPGKRDAFILYQVNKKERLTTSSEIFRKCAFFKYLEGENDFATKEFRSMKS